MPSIIVYDAERTQGIEDSNIVSGYISGDNLILVQHDGGEISAGDVRGPMGATGSPGAAVIDDVTSSTRPASPVIGYQIYETDTGKAYVYGGVTAGWVKLIGVKFCTASTRPPSPFDGMQIYETDSKRHYVFISPDWVLITGRAGFTATIGVQGIADSTVQNILWTAQYADTDNFFTPGSYTGIVPAGLGGLYVISAQWNFAPDMNLAHQYRCGVQGGGWIAWNEGIREWGFAQAQVLAELVPGDAISGMAWQVTGPSVDSTAGYIQAYRVSH